MEEKEELRKELAKAKKREELLYHISRRLKSKFNLADVSEEIIKGVTEATGAVTSTLYTLATDKRIDFTHIYGADEKTRDKLRKTRLEMGEGIAGSVIKEKKPYICLDAQKDPRFLSKVDRDTGFLTRSMICTPLIIDTKVVGAIQVINKKGKQELFDESDLDLLGKISDLAAIAIEKARLYEESAEIDMARRIQEEVLPRRTPEVKGVEIAAMNVPARQLGGDYYDFVPFSGEKLGMLIADISGKGVPAALFSFFTRGAFRNFAKARVSAREVVSRMSNFLYRGKAGGVFATAIYSIYDARKKRLIYSDAGHGYMIICRKGKELAPHHFAKSGGLPLGLMLNTPYGEGEIELTEGDVIVYYTDGIVEARNRRGELFCDLSHGTEGRLKRLVEDNSYQDAEEIMNSIDREVKEHVGGGEQSDDKTIIVMKVDGRVERLGRLIRKKLLKRKDLPYHNWQHTLFVLRNARRIGRTEGVDMDIVSAAALLHDIGYLRSAKDIGHEEAGVEMARPLLKRYSFSRKEIDLVCSCILSTRISAEPVSMEEKVLNDADHLQFAKEDYFEDVAVALLEEMRAGGRDVGKEEIIRNTPDVMRKWHRGYYTAEGRRLGEEGFRRNLQMFMDASL